ncbi:MAG TPA: hypothetical protein VF644_10570 [Pyrinomonadaceae bacterium]|jgi:hypothetical protein
MNEENKAVLNARDVFSIGDEVMMTQEAFKRGLFPVLFGKRRCGWVFT